MATWFPGEHISRVSVSALLIHFNQIKILLKLLFFYVFWFSIKPFSQQAYAGGKPPSTAVSGDIDAGHPPVQSWEGRAIATHKFRLLEFMAFMEIQREETVSFCFIQYDKSF